MGFKLTNMFGAASLAALQLAGCTSFSDGRPERMRGLTDNEIEMLYQYLVIALITKLFVSHLIIVQIISRSEMSSG